MPEEPNTPKYTLLRDPLKEHDCDIDGSICGTVPVPLTFVLHNDFERVMDKLSELLVGNELLMGIHYNLVGMDEEEQELHFFVEGDASLAFERD